MLQPKVIIPFIPCCNHRELYRVATRCNVARLSVPPCSRREHAGQRDEGTFDQSGEESLADKYEYVMHGKVPRAAPRTVW